MCISAFPVVFFSSVPHRLHSVTSIVYLFLRFFHCNSLHGWISTLSSHDFLGFPKETLPPLMEWFLPHTDHVFNAYYYGVKQQRKYVYRRLKRSFKRLSWRADRFALSPLKVSPYLDGILEAWLAVNVPNVVTPFSLTDGHQRFFGSCSLYLRLRRFSQCILLTRCYHLQNHTVSQLTSYRLNRRYVCFVLTSFSCVTFLKIFLTHFCLSVYYMKQSFNGEVYAIQVGVFKREINNNNNNKLYGTESFLMTRVTESQSFQC
jgi:hypothetical protein